MTSPSLGVPLLQDSPSESIVTALGSDLDCDPVHDPVPAPVLTTLTMHDPVTLHGPVHGPRSLRAHGHPTLTLRSTNNMLGLFQLSNTSNTTSNTPSNPSNTVSSRRRPNRRGSHTRQRRRRQNTQRNHCPVCRSRIIGSPTDMNEHVEYCLAPSPEPSEPDGPHIEDPDMVTTEFSSDRNDYVIDHDHTMSSLFPDALGGVVTKIKKDTSDSEVDIEMREEAEFGQAQFSEADVVPFLPADEPLENEERLAIREAVLGTSASAGRPPPNDFSLQTRQSYRLRRSKGCTNLVADDEEQEDDADGKKARTSALTSQATQTEDDYDPTAPKTIAFLKARLKNLEKTEDPSQDDIMSQGPLSAPPPASPFRCLICMDVYQNPLVSVSCWHVHCEQCWLQVMGVKKLCPQCNTITSPFQLRKLFL